MPSKLIIDRQKNAAAVIAAAETHAERIGQTLSRTLAPYLTAGEVMPDLALVVKLLGRAQNGTAVTMIGADQTHELELREDDAPRRTRDELSASLAAKLIALRDLVTALYGAAAVRALGLGGDTPDGPLELLRKGRQVANALGSFVAPPPRIAGATVDFDAIAGELATLAHEFAT